MKFVAVSHSIYLLETLVSSAVANIHQTSVPRSTRREAYRAWV
ncbi:hypothetical protein [Pilibacter termitis]|nr:hypothetical protein [Pilibacter termitis]